MTIKTLSGTGKPYKRFLKVSLLLLLPAKIIVCVTLYFSQLDYELPGGRVHLGSRLLLLLPPQEVLSKSWGQADGQL